MKKLSTFLLIIFFFNIELTAMEKRPYHHLPDGTFRNPEGSPERDPNVKWSYKKFNTERKKIEINFPKEHVVPKNEVLKNLEEIKIIEFDHNDVVRHPLVSKIIRAYQKKSIDDKD